MNHEPVRLGRLSRAIENALGVPFEGDVFVYILAADVDEMAKEWPQVYLKRLEEASMIIRHCDYASYLKEKETLYLIREYLKDGIFTKVALELVHAGQWHLKGIFALNNEKTKELYFAAGIERIAP